MAKEMMITFIYDTKLLQREEDDPATAILYFHPGWVSDQQRTSLCGQIVGTSHFLTSVFKCPRVYSLQTGKFAIRMYGRYLLAVGTDRNIANWVLEHRADTLTSLISFFHCDFNKLTLLYQEPTNLSAKLYFMFETYLKILTYGGHMFYNIPTILLPKSASHVFLETIQFLQWCQQLNFVLGGTVLYHNKVVATQLSSNLTKQIVFTDPYRIKSPAESVCIDFTAPLGVQLLHVYIPKRDYFNLAEDAAMMRSVPQNQKMSSKKASKPREPILSAMKRDQSIIFTTVPEEDLDEQVPSHIQKHIIPKKSPDRPTFLNLRNKTTEFVEITKPQLPAFLGQTSVCSTPMTDLNKVVHQNIMSICVNPEELELKENLDNFTNNIEKKHSINNVYDTKQTITSFEFGKKLKSFNRRTLTRHYSGISNFKNTKVPKRFRSIADPLYPIFKANGCAVSRSLLNEYLNDPLNFLELDLPRPFSPIKTKKPDVKKTTPTTTPPPKKSRKSLSLPLKSLTSEQQPELLSRNGGVQLTPLMAKLSFLANEDKASGFCTPSDGRFTPSRSNYSFLGRQTSISEDSNDTDLVEVVLLVCGQQDMVMGLLLENGVRGCPETIIQLWEKCTESLGKLQRQLRHCLETYQGSSQNETAEPYSYLCMDPQWDTVRRGGPWNGTELGVLTHLHRDFLTENLTEIILRNEESIVYGHHCGKTEVFYQQGATNAAGLPTPADLMGTVALKAKRRLERDHAIILL